MTASFNGCVIPVRLRHGGVSYSTHRVRDDLELNVTRYAEGLQSCPCDHSFPQCWFTS